MCDCLPADLTDQLPADIEASEQHQDVQCHKIVLCSSSPGYWRRRILAWLPAPAALDANAPAPPANPSTAAGNGSRSVGSAIPLLEEHCTPEEQAVCLAVLRHMYTVQLPEGADMELAPHQQLHA